ncbi:hypothetical protein MKX03_007795 [Papaver bracteatum]|nr:hypothetical protein MKX03_007795 [Papaver bracteatum]
MSKALLNFLTVGFFLMLAFSVISGDCTLKTGCGPTCSEHYLEGPSRCIVTTGASGPVLYTYYECECCKCAATKILNVNNCNIHKCDERCALEAELYGPSECREFYDENGKYVHKCYCCDREKKNLTAGTFAVA